MANKTFNINGKVNLDISGVQSQLSNMQKVLNNLKLPKNMSNQFTDMFQKLNGELSDYQEKLNKGFKTKSDVTGLEKTGNTIIHTLRSLDKEWDKLSKLDLNSIIKLNPQDAQRIAEIDNQIKALNQDLGKINTSNIEKFNKAASQVATKGAKNAIPVIQQLIGDGNYAAALDQINTKLTQLNNIKGQLKNTANTEISIHAYQEMQKAVNSMVAEQEKLNTASKGLQSERLNIYNNAVQQTKTVVNGAGNEITQMTQAMNQNHQAAVKTAQGMAHWNSEVEMVKSQATYFFGLSNSINLVKRALRSAFETVQELDKAMTETAVVTDMTVSDLWSALPKYTAAANKLGTTTLGAYQTMTLYYQQGLKTNEVFEIGTETMKMARIAGMEYTQATDLMTAALRGFNMELNEISAQRVNDVYSKLAAITASDTEEIATAMTKTASIANAANMEFETTAAFLTQMIETTRESAENLGTAMKTIIARFTEMKEAPSGIVNVDGEEVDVNKVDTALKSVGVSLKDTTGQFRDLDDVFLDLAKKWDTLDLMQQRYVATTAAGSRQQSRFIAMMDNYDRTMELVNAANNSAGASNEQFAKTTESLESKLNKLSNAWNEFTMGLANSTVIKTGVDLLTNLLNIINDITGAFGDGVGGALKFAVAIGGLKLGKSLTKKGFNFVGEALGSRETTPKEESGGFFKTAGKAFKKETWVGKKVDYSETIKDLNNYEQSVRDVSKAKSELAKIEENQVLLNKKVSKSDKEISSLNSNNRKKNKKVKKDLRERIKKNAKDPNGIEIKGKKKQDITPLEFATAERDKNAKAAQENIKQQVIAQQRLNSATVQQDAILKKLNITQTQNEALDKLGITTDQKAILLSNEKTSSLTKEIIANDKLSDEKKEKLLTDIAEEQQSKVGLLTKGKAIIQLLFMGEANRAAALQTLGLATSEEIATGATSGLATALLTLPIGWIIAGIAAIAAAFAIWDAATETNEEKLERLNTTIQETQEQLNETQEKLSSLSEEKESLATLTEEFEDLAKGTTEWKQKLIEVNQQVLSLIEKYPELAKYLSTGEGGVLEINEAGWNAQQEKLVEVAQIQSTALLSTNIEKAQLQQEMAQSEQLPDIEKFLTYRENYTDRRISLQGMLDTFVEQGRLSIDLGDIEDYGFNAQEGQEQKILKEANDYLLSMSQGAELIKNETQALSSSLVDSAGLANSKYADLLRQSTGTSEAFQKEKEEELAWGANDWGWDFLWWHDINDQARQEYAELMGLTKDEVNQKIQEGSLSKDTIKNALAANNAQKELTETLKKTEQAFSQLETRLGSSSKEFEAISSLITSQGEDLTKSELEAITGKIETDGVKGYSQEEVRAYLENSGVTIDADGMTSLGITVEAFTERIETAVDTWDDVYNQAEKFGLRSLIEPLLNDLQGSLNTGIEFTAKQASSLANILSQVETFGGDSEKLTGEIKTLLSQISDPKELENVISLLSATDWTSSSSIEQLVLALEDIGIKCDKDLTPSLIEVSKAINDINTNKLKDAIKNSLTIIEKLKDREETERTFDEDDYSELLPNLTPEMKKDFVFDGKDFVYIGDSIQSLIKALEENTKSKASETKDELFKQVSRGEEWKSKLEADKSLGESLEFLFNSGGLSDISLSDSNFSRMDKYIKNTLVNTELEKVNFLLESMGYEVDRSLSVEGQIERIKAYYSEYQELAKNQAMLEDMSNPLLLAGTTVEDIRKSTASIEEKEQAINKLIGSTAGAEELSRQLTKQFKKEGKAINSLYVNALALDLIEVQEAQDKLNSSVKDNLEILKKQKKETQGYSAAITSVTLAAQQVFGEHITSEFVEENLKDFIALSDEDEKKAEKAYRRIGVAAANAKIEILDLGEDTEKAKSVIETLGGMNIEIGATVDLTTLFNQLKKLVGSVEAAEEVIESMGFTVSYETEQKQVGLTWKYLNGSSFATPVPVYEEVITAVNITRNSSVGTGSDFDDKKDTSKDKDDKWENSYSKTYNINEDINEAIREGEKLEREYNKLLEDRSSTASDIYENYKAQLENLEKQKKLQTQMADKSRQEIANTVAQNSDLNAYATYNWEDMTIEINWENINKVTDKDLGDRINDYISELEGHQDSMDEANDAIEEIEETTKELEKQGHDQLVDFEQKVLDAIIDREEKKIEKLEQIDNSIVDGNSKLLDSIQSNLDKIRQERENEETERELSEKQAQLSYLQLDTSGANDLAIAQLEKELSEGQRDYTDTLIDQKLTELQEQNELASEERQAQIEVMKAQLEVAQNEGKYWNEAYRLITAGTDATGRLIHGSELTNILKEADNYSGLSKVQKMDWLSELEEQAKISIAQYSKENQLEKLGYYANQNVTFTNANGQQLTGVIQKDGSVKVSANGGTYTYKDVYRSADGSFKTLEGYGSYKKNVTTGGNGSSSGSKKYRIGSYVMINPNATIYKSSYGEGGDSQYFSNDPKYKIIGERNGYILTQHHSTKGYTGWFKPSAISKITKYETGGLADFTGPAWLDGTKSSPELVLNQKDTKNFLVLKDVLANLLNGNSIAKTAANSGDNYYEINIQVDKLESDYDVDDLATKVKKIITDDSRYRNVNTINFLR